MTAKPGMQTGALIPSGPGRRAGGLLAAVRRVGQALSVSGVQ